VTAEQILEAIRKSLGLPHLDATMRMGGVQGWDSMRHVKLLLDLEKVFKVRIPTDRFGSLTSVSALIAFLQTGEKRAA
jgi:acyl carrier protein